MEKKMYMKECYLSYLLVQIIGRAESQPKLGPDT